MQRKTTLKIFVLAVLLGLFSFFLFFGDLSSYFRPEKIKVFLTQMGFGAPFIYITIMALAIVISPIPSLPLNIAAGAVFGPLLGTLYSVVGALVGAAASFLIARNLGRELIEKYLGGHVNFCPRCSDRILTKIVFFSRLLPVVSFDIVSYGAGLTKMSLRKFSVATFFGMIPLTFIYNYFGSVLVFGRGVTIFISILMVILFFIIPRWLEKRMPSSFAKHLEGPGKK